MTSHIHFPPPSLPLMDPPEYSMIFYFCRLPWAHPTPRTTTSPQHLKTQTDCSVHFCSRAFICTNYIPYSHPPSSLPSMDPPEYSIACNFERAVCMHLFRFLVQHQAEYCKVAFSKPFQPRSHSLSPLSVALTLVGCHAIWSLTLLLATNIHNQGYQI